MKRHIQVRGNLIEFYETESFVETSLLPSDLPIGRVISPDRFIEMQRYIKSTFSDKVGTKIEIRDMEELKYSTCVTFGDGEGFVAVTPRGEIVSLLKSPYSKIVNFMGIAFANAIMVGGSRLDCYNCDNLGPSYCRRGFIPICKIDFDSSMCDQEMARLYKGECTEIVFFLYCGDPVYTYWQRMRDGFYIPLESYEYIPHIREIQKTLGKTENGTDYDFAGKFRDMVWGRWNGGLKDEYMFRPNKLMNYICGNEDRLRSWMRDYTNEEEK